MASVNGKKLMLIDGTVHMIKIIERAKELGVKTIIANFYEPENAKAKYYSDEYEVINISNYDEMKEMMMKHHVDGILQGCTDSHLVYYWNLCQIMGFPCYGTLEQYELCTNKRRMKELCAKYQVPVTKEYRIQSFDDCDLETIEFPVITKPVDGSGSRGFAICNNVSELKKAYENAKKYSISGEVLVEKYMDYKRSVIINYTIVDGHVYYSGMSDKISKKVSKNGSPIMALQFYPSVVEAEYLQTVDQNVQNMFINGMGLKNGVVWIEAFYSESMFTFNEMGYRFGGSMTYYPVEYFTGIKQLDLQIEYALTGKNEQFIPKPIQEKKKVYCIFPMHVKPGVIKKIIGFDELKARPELIEFVPTHLKDDVIESWGSTQQVFCYIHFVVDSREEAEKFIQWIISHLFVKGEHGEDMLYNLYTD